MTTTEIPSELSQVPDSRGRFGPYGGKYVPETLMAALAQLEDEYARAKRDPEFHARFRDYLKNYVGRPSPLYFAKRLSEECGRKVYLKREDLNHTGSHKINNTIGQALLTLRMGKPRIIAETGAGQHGVATATAAAMFGLKCEVYMGSEDVRRQELNVFRMKMLGAKVNSVESGSRTLRDAINEAMRDWMGSVANTHYCIGSVMGPHPFPMMVRDFQAIIGREAREQCLAAEGRLPTHVVACVGGGSNAAGIFHPFAEDKGVKMIGVEAGGRGAGRGQHAATISHGRPGVLHGMYTYVLQDDEGQTADVHSVSAGLDYPGVGPEHSYWNDVGRVQYVNALDDDSLFGFERLSLLEGIIPALETAHAIAYVLRHSREWPADAVIVINCSGRGDKDCMEVARLKGM